MTATSKAHDPITPGEILLTEFLEPLGITQYRLAQATGLPQARISEIVRGKRAITIDTALRLSLLGFRPDVSAGSSGSWTASLRTSTCSR